jgi:hypothetical protein
VEDIADFDEVKRIDPTQPQKRKRTVSAVVAQLVAEIASATIQR